MQYVYMQLLARSPLNRAMSAANFFAISLGFYMLYCYAATGLDPLKEPGSPVESLESQTGLSLGSLPDDETKIMGPLTYYSFIHSHKGEIPLDRVVPILLCPV